MDRHTADEVLDCLPRDRTLFHYYRDRYSIGLLRQLARTPTTVAALKRTPFAALAQKPRVKAILAQLGGDRLHEAQLALHDYDPAQTPFVLTLDVWGSEKTDDWRYKQTSRPGYNLVLQLNFCKHHDQRFQRLGAKPDAFARYTHPNSTRRNTLAWARIDFDWASGTALIEEIQSDWIRRAAWLANLAERKLARLLDAALPTGYLGLDCSLQTTLDYCRFVRDRYQPIWAEAMLWATLDFLRNELGLSRIYYHTMDSGRLLKRIDGVLPPLSLYTDLPRKFCFDKTEQAPAFVQRERHAAKVLRRNPRTAFQRIELV
jgi:hypothetical protein